MSLGELPDALRNSTNEHCFLSCAGMALAHYNMLGYLGLTDIIDAVEVPGEDITPMDRVLQWLIDEHGLAVEYVEEMDETDPDSFAFISSLKAAGVTYTSARPTMQDVFRHVDKGLAVLTQVNYDNLGNDSTSLEPDHVIYLGSHTPGELITVIDPDGPHFAVEDISDVWGDYPNLIIFRDKSIA